MSNKKSPEATCPVCGKVYTKVGSRKYCSDECRIKALSEQKHNYYVRMRALALGKTEEEVRADEKKKALDETERLEQLVERATKLDRKVAECHANGQSYAEVQRAETIEKFARVEVPEAFQNITAETPEAPKPLTVYMDPAKITDEDLSKGGLGGHGPTVCIITPAEPEQPAERRRMSYLSKEQREALIKVETEAEILKEFFRSEGFDASEFPGNILERMAEQLKQLLEVAE